MSKTFPVGYITMYESETQNHSPHYQLYPRPTFNQFRRQ